jgi:hypothetical protein
VLCAAFFLLLLPAAMFGFAQLKTIASAAGLVDGQARAAKAAAGTTSAIPGAVVEEAQKALESLKVAANKG